MCNKMWLEIPIMLSNLWKLMKRGGGVCNHPPLRMMDGVPIQCQTTRTVQSMPIRPAEFGPPKGTLHLCTCPAQHQQLTHHPKTTSLVTSNKVPNRIKMFSSYLIILQLHSCCFSILASPFTIGINASAHPQYLSSTQRLSLSTNGGGDCRGQRRTLSPFTLVST